MNDLSKILKKVLKDKDYRHAYFDELLNVSIATQIKVLREQRGRSWSQKDLADKVGMKQPRISVMENVNYSSWSINTLRKLAEAFDLRLRVSFESFGSGIIGMEKFNRETLERPLFEDDPDLVEREEGRATAATKAFSDIHEERAIVDKKPTLWLVPGPSAESAQSKKTSQGGNLVPQSNTKSGESFREKQRERAFA